jgi:hypothetical protein
MVDVQRSDEPTSRATRLTQRVADALTTDPEYVEGDRAVVLVLGAKDAGLVTHGYPLGDEEGAVADIAMFAWKALQALDDPGAER